MAVPGTSSRAPAAQAKARTAARQSAVPGYVPAQYRADVARAAAQTGLPASVVAAQINDESGFNPRAVSSTGAQGIAQFEPGTWATWGHGSPFTPSDAFAAYARFMSALLKQEHGSVRNALAAYNAGAQDIPAGLGYADTILANAHTGQGLRAGSGTGAPSGAPSGGGLVQSLEQIPGLGFLVTLGGAATGVADVANALAAISQNLEKFLSGIAWFFDPLHWFRIVSFAAGVLLAIGGVTLMVKAA